VLGQNDHGQLGDGTYTSRTAAVDVVSLTSGVVAISSGRNTTCAVTTTGGIKCWGDLAQSLDYATSNQNTPIDVSGLPSGVTAVSVGHQHNCAVTVSGGVKCWGNNKYG